jgi:uncharacterized membrane protein
MRSVLLYVLVALPAGIGFAVLTPPFQAPDEVGHYWRAEAIAAGQFGASKEDGKPGAFVPREARDLVAILWMELAGRDALYERERLQRASELPRFEERVRVTFPAYYTALPYLPQAAVLAAARAARVPPLTAFRAGRIANVLAGVTLVAIAMLIAPRAAWTFGVVALTPMFLFLSGACSADTVTSGVAFCTIAVTVRLWDQPDDRRLIAAAALTALLVTLCKPAYVLLPLLAIAALRRRAAAIVAAATAAGIALSAFTAGASHAAMRPGTDPAAQLQFTLAHPFRVASIIARDYAAHAFQYTDHLVGRLGWLDVGLPRWVLVLYLAAFLYVALCTPLQLPARRRALIAAIFVATMAVVSLSQYLVWTPLHADAVEGIQGRYFLPAAPLALIALAGARAGLEPWLIAATAAACNVAALAAVARRYYGA